MAHSAPAPHRQRPRLLVQTHERGRGYGGSPRQPRCEGDSGAEDDPIHTRHSAQVLDPQRRRDRTFLRVHRASGIDSIHVVQTAISRLLDLLPAGEVSDATREDFNARSRYEMERIRDFIILHYHANQREGEPFWDELRAMEVPTELQHKMDLFRASGRIHASFDELFDARAWIQVMIGQNVLPESWNPLADVLPEPRLREFLEGVERAHLAEVSQMPDHGAFVARFAPVKRELIPA